MSVPVVLRPHFGKREIIKSLRTRNPAALGNSHNHIPSLPNALLNLNFAH
jgi:hypothetical protein